MAIGIDSLVEFSVGGLQVNQTWMNVFTYKVTVGSPSTTAPQWGEALWNHLKATYRALVSTDHTQAFRWVRVREMDSATGEYGEFAIPTGERAGTLAAAGSHVLPVFTAGGVRLTVATRETRPGQKRVPGAREADSDGNAWEAGYLTALGAFGAVIAGNAVLGAPALASVLSPVVVSRDSVTGLPVADQPVTGYLVNPYVTSQVSRKVGRGA